MQEVEQDREVILREAFEQAESIREEARSEGYEAGNKQLGFDEGADHCGGSDSGSPLLLRNRFSSKGSRRAIEEDAVQLILDTVERILGKHIQEDYDLVLGIIRLAMTKLTYTEA